jgi:hypothetical protein
VKADRVVECDYSYLSKKTINDEFSFSATPEQKKKTSGIRFWRSSRIAHVPQNLREEFLSLTWLWITGSEIPIVKNNLLGPQFSWIERLKLDSNEIQIVENQAFQHLHNLVMISLAWNQLQSLNAEIFKNNPKLIWIFLWLNKIKTIAPETFQHLNQLKFVRLWINECTVKEIGCLDCDTKIDHTELNRELQKCYENHKKSLDLLNEGENIFK